MNRENPTDGRRGGDVGPDFDRYQCFEEQGEIVIRDREVDGAWIRSSLSYELDE